MQNGSTDPGSPPALTPEYVNPPVEVAVPTSPPVPEYKSPTSERKQQVVLLVGVGAAIGLAVGVVLSIGAYWTYTLFTKTLSSTTESLQVFNELNELRQQINALNDEKKQQELEHVEALRALTARVRAPENNKPEAGSQAKEQTARADKKPARPPGVDPFADIDAEIENLERTGKVLNSILDMFTKQKEPAKNR
jgi:hypothetical protein